MTHRWIIGAGLAALAMASSCTPRAEVADTVPAAVDGPGSVRGTVRVVGSAPVNVQVVVQPEGGASVRVEGPLAAEIRNLAGAEVVVTGTIASSGDPVTPRVVTATDYEIMAIDGRPVVMGEVMAVGAGEARLRIASGDEVIVTGAPASFRVGQKVWVQGPQTITVQSYGTLRP